MPALVTFGIASLVLGRETEYALPLHDARGYLNVVRSTLENCRGIFLFKFFVEQRTEKDCAKVKRLCRLSYLYRFLMIHEITARLLDGTKIDDTTDVLSSCL